jgi:hypothetical protein
MEGFFKLRRGIEEHLFNGSLSFHDLGVYVTILLQANYYTGQWWGSTPRLTATAPRSANARAVQRSIERLQKLGFLKVFRKSHGTRGNYGVLINKFEPTIGALKGKWLNAALSGTYEKPAYGACAEESLSSRCDVGEQTPIQDKEEEEKEKKKESNKAKAPEPVVHFPEAITAGASGSTATEAAESPEATKLATTLFTLLDRPQQHSKKLPEWTRRAATLLADLVPENVSPDQLAAALNWALTEDSFWPKVLFGATDPMALFSSKAQLIVSKWRGEQVSKANAGKNPSPKNKRAQRVASSLTEDTYEF